MKSCPDMQTFITSLATIADINLHIPGSFTRFGSLGSTRIEIHVPAKNLVAVSLIYLDEPDKVNPRFLFFTRTTWIPISVEYPNRIDVVAAIADDASCVIDCWDHLRQLEIADFAEEAAMVLGAMGFPQRSICMAALDGRAI